MNSKYQKYYDKLKDKNFNAYILKYTSLLSTLKLKLDSISNNIANSNLWSELGLDTLKTSTIPKMSKMESRVDKGISSLKSASDKTATLVSKLASLDSECKAYESASEENKDSYRSRINSLESEIDGIINEINSITIEKLQDDVSSIQSFSNISSTIAEKKAAFLGDVDDLSQYTQKSNYKTMRKQMTAFDNTTGEILKEGSTIYMKPGEKRILTVKLPTNTGAIGEIKRTSADGDNYYRSGKYVKSVCDVDPDPNNIDFVNYKPHSNHFPPGVDLHQNHYDWIITANHKGDVMMSQTCEYTLKDEPNWYAKAMYDLNVVVKEDIV